MRKPIFKGVQPGNWPAQLQKLVRVLEFKIHVCLFRATIGILKYEPCHEKTCLQEFATR